MKNTILFTALFSLLTLGLNAQGAREELKFGLKGGLTMSNVYDSDGEEFDSDAKFGYTAGLNLELPLGKFLGLHPEVLVTQKGFKGSGSILGAEYSYKRTTTYLEVPVLIAFKPTDLFSIVAGPQFAYLLEEKNEFDSSPFSYDQEEQFEQDDIRKNLLGFVGGVNLNFEHFTVGGRIGFDFQKNRGDGSSETPRYKNIWGQLTVGYRFY